MNSLWISLFDPFSKKRLVPWSYCLTFSSKIEPLLGKSLGFARSTGRWGPSDSVVSRIEVKTKSSQWSLPSLADRISAPFSRSHSVRRARRPNYWPGPVYSQQVFVLWSDRFRTQRSRNYCRTSGPGRNSCSISGYQYSEWWSCSDENYHRFADAYTHAHWLPTDQWNSQRNHDFLLSNMFHARLFRAAAKNFGAYFGRLCTAALFALGALSE